MIKNCLLVLIAIVCSLRCHAQIVSAAKTNDANLQHILGFEKDPVDAMPGGWGGGPKGTVFADDKIVHGGHWSARIERQSDSTGTFSTITNSLPIDFSGSSVSLKGFVRTEDVKDFAGLWLRVDGDGSTLAFDNMQRRQLKGTTAWTEYSITLPLAPEAKRLVFGFLLTGTGKAWADDLQLLVDDKPVWEVPKVAPVTTILDSDHQFDNGSGITITQLTPIQIDNLAMLGKVWGFLKYHHPLITSGQRHWDYELFRILPAVLAAQDHASANAALLHWISSLGTVDSCKRCAELKKTDLDFPPDLAWISNKAMLGADLSDALLSIYNNRSINDKQFYISLVPKVGNPSFDHELQYQNLKFPDSGFQLLALYRFWNIVEYWSPDRDVIGEDWNRVLAEFIPRIALAKDSESYQRELMALIAMLHDTHANLWSSLDVRPPVGKCSLPIRFRFINKLAVFSGRSSDGDAPDLKLGDVITKLDGVPVEQLVEKWTPYYADSNQAARLRDMARSMTRGDCDDAALEVHRGDTTLKLNVKRIPISSDYYSLGTHDLPGPAFRLLSKQVAYLKLSSVKADDAPAYIKQAAGTKGLVIDIRNYPSEFMVFALGSLLEYQETSFVRFTKANLSNPGAFYWSEPLSITPQQPHYNGKVVILVDELSQSQAEYTTMAFRSVPGAVVVGSTTAGADGNVSPFALPGGFHSMISGLGIFYPDKTPTQQVGIVPNVVVVPTIAGIRDGRDEVLEEGVRQILGSTASQSSIEEMIKAAIATARSTNGGAAPFRAAYNRTQ